VTHFPDGFLWGAATAAHQVEGGNWNNDWWQWEQAPGSPCAAVSGDACDHYHRYAEDIGLLADAGLNTYRFSLEWSRIEPEEGQFSLAALDHYLRMCAACHERGVLPVVTFHHFTSPRWLAARGGWADAATPGLFARFCERATRHLGDAVGLACTINEPQAVVGLGYMGDRFPPGSNDPSLWQAVTDAFIEAHRLGRDAIKSVRPDLKVGITLAMAEWEAVDGGESRLEQERQRAEDVYLDAVIDDDFVGVQAYFRNLVGPEGRRPVPEGGEMTLYGWEFRPQAIEAAVRHAWDATGGRVPLLVTENGVAMADDRRRVAFIAEAVAGIGRCLADGIDIGGYLYWTLIDNFEWTSGFAPTFGLIGCDRTTLAREVRPSARFLGEIAKANALPAELPVS
jgi:beta-glucosidase